MTDRELARFVDAQDDGGTYERALEELRAGRKTTHWMWFVFPQLAGLGKSETARYYAVTSLDEAREYLTHPRLGPRLLACCETLLTHTDRTADAILGDVDGQKLRSSMTLFARADPAQPVFTQVLDRFYDGKADAATDGLLASSVKSSGSGG